MAEATKDTVYIDVDDEITSIIEKLQNSQHKIVALVLPKRATTLQSIVNMKLLKRAATEADKRIVLITSEANLLPLAGIVGLHVAKTLQSKPLIPKPPEKAAADMTFEDDGSALPEPPIDAKKTVGELADLPEDLPTKSFGAVTSNETIDVDNSADMSPDAIGEKPKKSKDKSAKIKIPNFERFRIKLILFTLLILAIGVGWAVAFTILPKAKVVVKTDTTTIDSEISFAANAAAKEIDFAKSVVPASTKELKKVDSLKVTATGQKNVGNKAKGTITITNCINDGQSHTLPAGTTFTAVGLSFATDAEVVLDPALYSGNVCKSSNFGLSKDVTVTAGQSGDNYNLSARAYGNSIAGISGYGSAMSGGTTQNLTIVSQKDVDEAKQQLTDKSKDAAVSELAKVLQDAKLTAINDSINGSAPTITSSPAVGEEAGEVSVTATTTYSMIGLSQDVLKKLLDTDAKKKIDLVRQPIVDYGLAKAVFKVSDRRSGSDQTMTMQSTVVAGTKIDPDALKREIAGKKRGDVISTVQTHPGVKEVTVTYSPFWVAKIPKNSAKVTIVFEQTGPTAKKGAAN